MVFDKMFIFSEIREFGNNETFIAESDFKNIIRGDLSADICNMSNSPCIIIRFPGSLTIAV